MKVLKWKIIVLMSSLFYLISCNKFLDVVPEDKFIKESIFKDKYNIYKSLNGVYLNLAKPDLYGGELSMKVPDILAQYYNYTSTSAWNTLASYKYQDISAVSMFRSIWTNTYKGILNVNSFIDGVNASDGVITDDQKKLMLGESYGVRAFLHLDLLRLYGPIYTKDSDKAAIPYIEKVTEESQAILSAKMVMEKILADLDTAITYLSKDPIRMNGVVYDLNNDPESDFFKMRNRRFNYYVAMGIKARALLYKGDKENALKTAESLILEAGKWFKWSPEGSSLPNIIDPDRVFSSEVIFGLESSAMYNLYRNYFDASLDQSSIMAPTEKRLEQFFENNKGDFRYRVNWDYNYASGKSYKTFLKYKDITNAAIAWRNFQPLFRLSEVYYIASECSENMDQALSYLNEVRRNRGLVALGNSVSLENEIMNEYRREFWGEGQLFYYFKRKNIKSITRGTDSQSSIVMSDANYIIPIPKEETDYR